MLKNTLFAAVLGATALAPISAGSYATASAEALVITPLGLVIATQGNEALRAIQSEARLCLRSLKPAPLEAYVLPVKRDVAPEEIAQGQLAL